MSTPKSVREYLSSLGRKGGSVTSEAKAAAARANAKKPRPNRKKKRISTPANRSMTAAPAHE